LADEWLFVRRAEVGQPVPRIDLVAAENLRDRFLQAGVRVGDDQLLPVSPRLTSERKKLRQNGSV
jgi:hypothetical protein